MADIWGAVNYAEADSFSCVSNIASIAQVQSDPPVSNMLYPVNGKDILIAMAQAGETIYKHQLQRLSREEKDAVLSALSGLGKPLDMTWPVADVARK